MTPAPADRPAPPAPVPVPPDLLAWAKQTFDEDAFLREVREIEATGGCEFESFVAELRERAGAS